MPGLRGHIVEECGHIQVADPRLDLDLLQSQHHRRHLQLERGVWPDLAKVASFWAEDR